MKIKNLLSALLVLILLTLFIGCTDGDDNNSDIGKLTVQITDAPFPHDLVAEANVTIFKIEARSKHIDIENVEENVDGTENNRDEEDSFIILMEEEMEMNLLSLTNGITETLVETNVSVGTYDLLRIYVKGINIVLKDGTTFDLNVPSGQQTGIKVFIKPGIVVSGGLSADLLLDFDVSKSFVPKGNRNDFSGITGFNFKPVIKACNKTTSGTLSGIVSTVQEEVHVGLEGAQIEIFTADTLNTTTFSDESGAYMVLGLMAGTYDVIVELEGYDSVVEEEIEIIKGNKTLQDFELTPIP
ncbi:DUF4382 domain-containing protein [Maribacter sp. HTCC2170]|uniref:DUF4382 domain-containing protein n=1 Tax=Maribacter sp. (strain HTCC2170 / KCCM 42371) TaxID=313603 RepID=UPI00006AFD14|nr:DUF4382 domain-containing protein [Maribacter sp. HTCC2170]EAR01360.1 putative lipoprotein [Maribacter sp. HTCC2170]